jgi:hypothetical protein
MTLILLKIGCSTERTQVYTAEDWKFQQRQREAATLYLKCGIVGKAARDHEAEMNEE